MAPISDNRISIAILCAEKDGRKIELNTKFPSAVDIFETVHMKLPENTYDFSSAWSSIDEFSVLLLSSANSLKFFLSGIEKIGAGDFPERFKRKKIWTIGRKTADYCHSRGLQADLVPGEFSAEGLMNMLSGTDISGEKILYPHSEAADGTLDDFFKRRGSRCFSFVSYIPSVPPEELQKKIADRFMGTKFCSCIFLSPSSFDNLRKILGKDRFEHALEDSLIAAIGKRTASHIEEAGFNVTVVPDKQSVDGIAKALDSYYLNR